MNGTCDIIRAPVERCFDPARSVEVHLAWNVHFGEMAVATAGVTLPLLGRVAEVTFLGRYMQVLLRERNAVIKEIAESSGWQRYLP